MTAQDQFDLGDMPETADILDALAQSLKVGLRTHVPARIVSFDPATQTAVVQVEHQTVVRLRSLEDLPPGAELIGTPPNAKAVLAPQVVQGIPVIFHGTPTAYLTVPITPGVTGTLHVHDRALDIWLLKGAPCDPLFAWTHVLESSEFHPGLHPKTQPITPPTDLAATVLEGPLVKIGRLATLGAARVTDPLTASGNLSTWAAAVEAALLAATSPIAPASSWATLTLGAAAQLGTVATGSTKVTVE